MRAGSGGLNGEVCLDIGDVVRDEPTILRNKMEDLRDQIDYTEFCRRGLARQS